MIGSITINDIEYNVKVVNTPEDRIKGLQGVTTLPKNEGMLFVFNKPQTVSFWMKDTYIPLDIIFIDEDLEVISVYEGEPESKELVEEDNVKYVLELNANSGVKEGDELEFEDEPEDEPENEFKDSILKVIDSKGGTQMELSGGERVISRKETKTLIKKAKLAESVKNDPDKFKKKCKSLGKYMFKILKGQDNRDPEYVTLNS